MAEKTKARSNKTGDTDAVVVKKYANRRLYNTATSSYVTLEDLSTMVKDGADFVVYDAKTGEDITHSVLTQIIFEQESRGQNLLPIAFLRKLIRFYGDSLQSVVPSYLEMSMDAFTRQGEEMREKFAEGWTAKSAMGAFEEQAAQNMAFFEQAMRMFAPMATGAATPETPPEPPKSDDSETILELRRQMAAMQERLNSLAGE